jgi:acyl-CoA thioesterase FadM
VTADSPVELLPGQRFAARARIRFDEAGPSGHLRPSGYLRLAQDVAWQHSDDLGFDREWYAARELTWVVRAVRLEIDRPLAMGREADVVTTVQGAQRVWARRLVTFSEPAAAAPTPGATAVIDWVLLDGRGRPARLPGEFAAAFGLLATGEPITRVRLPDAPREAARGSVAVRASDLDPLGHANNGVYVDWLEDAVRDALAAGPASATIGPDHAPVALAIEYLVPAVGGDVLATETWPVDDGWAHRLLGGGRELVRARIAYGRPQGSATA